MMPRNRFVPQDIMLCILTRLPVESLVRFKSVCKSWCELFAAPEFIKMHINQFSEDPKNEALIIRCFRGYLIGSEEKKPCMINFNISDIPKCLQGSNWKLAGCLHGLLCMVSSASGVDEKLVLWNPALKIFKIVQFPINRQGLELSFQYRWNSDLLRLGYDAEEAEIKVVVPVRSKEENVFDKALVYSANSDSWKKIDMDFEYFFVSRNTQCNTGHENPYWDVIVDGKRVLMYFDVRNLVFKNVPFIWNWNDQNRVIQFMYWKGSIGALITNFASGINNAVYVEIWVLSDGEEKIWRKNHTFGPMDVWSCLFRLCTKTGKLIVVDLESKLLVSDPKTRYVVEEIISGRNSTRKV